MIEDKGIEIYGLKILSRKIRILYGLAKLKTFPLSIASMLTLVMDGPRP